MAEPESIQPSADTQLHQVPGAVVIVAPSAAQHLGVAFIDVVSHLLRLVAIDSTKLQFSEFKMFRSTYLFPGAAEQFGVKENSPRHDQAAELGSQLSLVA
jgi:hypothetical protein